MVHGRIGTAASETLYASGGGIDHHQIWGLGGDDTLFGWTQTNPDLDTDDELYGDRQPLPGQIQYNATVNPPGVPGNDALYGGAGRDKLYGDEGDDWLNGGIDNDTLDGGAGFDFVDYSGASAGVSVDLYDPSVNTGSASGADGNDKIIGVEGIFGSSFNDTLEGENNANSIYGNDGDDFLDGGIGSDFLDGGDGSDFVVGGSQDDDLRGGVGDDKMYGGFDNDYLDGWEGNDYLQGDDGDDVLVAWKGNDTLYGGEGHDWLDGSYNDDILHGGAGDDILGNSVAPEDGNDKMYGEDGNDSLYGGAGNDILNGGSGSDVLVGGAGNDILIGGAGNDTLTSGSGLNVFRFNNIGEKIDKITDFASYSDDIQVVKSGFSSSLNLGKISSGQFRLGSSAGDSSDRFIYNQSTGALFFDKDGTGSAAKVQFATLSNKASLSYTDIVVIA